MSEEKAKLLREIADSPRLLEIARAAIENTLVEWRDSRLSSMRGNGLVIREPDGTPSSVVRFGPEVAVTIGLRAIADELSASQPINGSVRP